MGDEFFEFTNLNLYHLRKGFEKGITSYNFDTKSTIIKLSAKVVAYLLTKWKLKGTINVESVSKDMWK